MTWVGNLPRPIDGGFLIDGLLERNQNNSIHGDGAVGKSFLALAACISVTTGLEVIPGYKPMARGPALYCDNETDQDTMNYRVQQIARGLGIEPPNIGYLRMDRAFADETERIAEMIQQYGFLLTVIDSVEAAMAGSTSHGASQLDGPSRLNRSIRRIGPVTTLLIDHINAEQSDSDGVIRRPYGSIFKRNWVRRSFHLKQATEAVDGYRHLGLFIAKVNNAAEPPPVGLRWAINDETCTWDRENLDEPELTSALPVVERIARYLTLFGPSPPASIGEYTGISTSTIRSILMRRPGVFVRDPIKGLWDNVIDSDVSSMDDRYIANDDDVGDLP